MPPPPSRPPHRLLNGVRCAVQVQLELLDSVISTGTPTVIVLVHGRPASFGEDAGGAVTSKFGERPLYMRAAAVVAAFRPVSRTPPQSAIATACQRSSEPLPMNPPR